MLSKELYRTYVQILKDELVPAMGCTEPIAIAYILFYPTAKKNTTWTLDFPPNVRVVSSVLRLLLSTQENVLS